jgi:Animal haem peroxidase
MFPPGRESEYSDDVIEELVRLMSTRAPAAEQRENLRIPAGFTYLGQFIDHDITFDPTSKLDQSKKVRARINFRTPRYDLDSVYGSGPVAQPFLYDWKESEPPGTKLLVGHNALNGVDDLPRNQQGRALIGDPRNDENLIIAQLHLLFIRFHNAVVDLLSSRGDVAGPDLFDEAQRLVCWHYQWIVVHEFLPKVVGKAVADSVFAQSRDGRAPKVHRKYFRWKSEPFIPVEFSGAAYRFGHSMVRNQYGITRPPDGGPPPHATNLFPQLAGFTWLSKDLVIDWERFFEFPGLEILAQPSFQIDTAVAKPLFKLPDRGRALPRLNLRRGGELKLPSGQKVAAEMRESELPEEALLLDDQVPPRIRQALLDATPLWYYVLCEAAHAGGGSHLGPVGGRIVAEVLVGLLEGDPNSYLARRPTWQPGELGTGNDFTMVDLVKVAQRVG